MLQPRHTPPVHEAHDRLEDELLDADAEPSHQRVHRPGEDALLGGRGAGGRTRVDPGLEAADGLVGIELTVVDVDAELLFDEAEELDPPQRVDPQVGREARLGYDSIGRHALDLAHEARDRAGGGHCRGRCR